MYILKYLKFLKCTNIFDVLLITMVETPILFLSLLITLNRYSNSLVVLCKILVTTLVFYILQNILVVLSKILAETLLLHLITLDISIILNKTSAAMALMSLIIPNIPIVLNRISAITFLILLNSSSILAKTPFILSNSPKTLAILNIILTNKLLLTQFKSEYLTYLRKIL